MFQYYNQGPGHYPNEDLHTQFYWQARALEELAQEEEEWARHCAQELEVEQAEYHALDLEWYSNQHTA